MEGGAVVGLFAARELDAVPRATWPSVRMNKGMQPLSQAVTVDERDELPDVFMRLLETDLRRALVLRDSRLTGVLSLSDVERLSLRGGSSRHAAPRDNPAPHHAEAVTTRRARPSRGR